MCYDLGAVLPDRLDTTDSRADRVEVDLDALTRDRRLRGWSKQDLAEAAGLKPSTISEIYRTGTATEPTWGKLLNAFDAAPPRDSARRLGKELTA